MIRWLKFWGVAIATDTITWPPENSREKITDLRHKAEDSYRLLYEAMIDDRNLMESKISVLERKLRELRGNLDSS